MAPADPHLLASAVVLDSAGRHVLLVRDEELGGSDLAAGWFPTDALPRDIDPGVRLHLSQAVRVTAAV